MVDPPIVELEDEWACGCGGRGGLDVLREVQRAYEERLEAIERNGGKDKLKLQAGLLRSWVGDLVGQNTLLARAVEQLEEDATASLRERRRLREKLSERRTELESLRRSLARKESDNRNLLKLHSMCLGMSPPGRGDGCHFIEVTESDIYGSNEAPNPVHEKINKSKLQQQQLLKDYMKISKKYGKDKPITHIL